MECDCSFFLFKTKKLIQGLSKVKEYIDFGTHRQKSTTIPKCETKAFGRYEIETHKCFWFDNICSPGAKSYSFYVLK